MRPLPVIDCATVAKARGKDGAIRSSKLHRVRFYHTIMALLVICLCGQFVYLKRHIETTFAKAVTQSTQLANQTATRLFVNELYPRIAQILPLNKDGRPIDKGLADDDLQNVDRAIRVFMLGTDILKIKLYTTSGFTVYSSAWDQIGEDKSQNTAFRSAVQGVAGSQITHRGKFSALDGQVFERDLVASYIPIRTKSAVIIGVAELYTDRTPVVKRTEIEVKHFESILSVFLTLTAVLMLVLAWSLKLRTTPPEMTNPKSDSE